MTFEEALAEIDEIILKLLNDGTSMVVTRKEYAGLIHSIKKFQKAKK